MTPDGSGEKSSDPGARKGLEIASEKRIETAWDRFAAMQPQCGFGELGLCCNNCLQGPCRINPYRGKPTAGICGARDYTIVARNLIRHIAGGAAAHSGHGRHIADTLTSVTTGRAPAYSIKDPAKLERVAKRLGIDPSEKGTNELARLVIEEALGDYTRFEDEPLRFTTTTITEGRRALLERHGLLPGNIDHAISDVMHRTSLGCDADPIPLLFGGIACAIADYDGMQISTDLSDILFGTPRLVRTFANLGTLKKDEVNIAIHGHNPVLSEVMVDVARELEGEAKAAGANGINVVGICCTGNETLMRKGVSLAANFSSQELALATGAVDLLVADYQCIMPSLSEICQCTHTEMVTTMANVHIPFDTHVQFREEDAKESTKAIVRLAIEAYTHRDPSKVVIPSVKAEVIAGFSLEQITELLSRLSPNEPFSALIEAIKTGQLRGIALMAGCNNQRAEQDRNHITIAKELLKNDVLVLATGCSAGALAKSGFLSAAATEDHAGPGLKKFIRDLENANKVALPPVWHVGSCVDNTRAMNLATELAKKLRVDVDSIPFVASAPEANHEKAVSIGTWCVALGLTVHVGTINYIGGSPLVTEVLTNTAGDVFGGRFIFEPDPIAAGKKLLNEVERRRWKLGWSNAYEVPEAPALKKVDLLQMAVDGAMIATGYAELLLSRAIEVHGYDKKVEFPETGYSLPAILAWEGKEVHRLGDLPSVLGDARSIIRHEPTYENALVAGEATMVAAEVIEALKYAEQEHPYEGTPYCGFIPDKILRELGIAFVDDTIPGAAVLVGAASDPKKLARIVRDCQSKGMLIIATFDTIRQLKDEGIRMGLDAMLYPVGEFTQAIHGLNFAIRAALTFGNVQKGDRERLQNYLKKRPKVFVLQLGPIDAIKAAAEFAVLLNGSPTITDQPIEEIPEKYISQPDYDHMVQTAIELRGIQVKLAPVSIPVAYGPAFEGETVRRPDTYIEAGGASKTTAFELLRLLPEDQVEDGKIEVIGKDVDAMQEGGKTPIAILVDVYGKKMQEEFEPVLERRIHQFINFAEGAWHTGQRNTIWIRLSKNSVGAGLRFKHFGDILITKLKAEFGNIVSRVQVTVITDQAKIDELLPEAKAKYSARDARIAGLTDDAVKDYYSCTLCVPAGEDIVLGDGSFKPIESFVEELADYGPQAVMSFATDHMIPRPTRELFVNPSPPELVEITLRNGNGVRLTPNHKVLSDSTEGLKWVRADQLQIGNLLVDEVAGFENHSSGSLLIIDYLPGDYKISDDSFYDRLALSVERNGGIAEIARKSGIPYNRLYTAINHGSISFSRLTIDEAKRVVEAAGGRWEDVRESITLFQSKARLLRTRLDEDVLYAAGLVASDGCVVWRGPHGRSGVFVQFTNTELELTLKFSEIIEGLFGRKPTSDTDNPGIAVSGTLVIHSRRPVTVSRVCNTLFGRLMNGLGIGLREREQKWTGYAISALPPSLVASFLKGLFDGDGHVTEYRAGFTTRTTIEARHIHLLLKRLGISSYISRVTRGIQVLTSSDSDAIRFSQIVGSNHPQKRKKLDLLQQCSHFNHAVRSDSTPQVCGRYLAAIIDRYGIPRYGLPVDGTTIKDWEMGKCRPSKEKLGLVLDYIENLVPSKDLDFVALRLWTAADVHFRKIRELRRVTASTDRVFNFSVDETHNYVVNGIVVKNCQSFAPDHVCIVTPERLGLCGAVNYLDAKAGKEIAPAGPNQPIVKGDVIDPIKGQWKGVNEAVFELSHHKLERFNAYTMMEDPMTSCGCFEVITAMTADAQAVVLVNREFPGMTPVGMKFSTLAGSIGGGKQTPGFIGIGRKYILSRKFISADGGFLRIAWMPKELKTQMMDSLRRRAEELGVPDFVEKIADETVVTDAEGLTEWMAKVNHPALSMPPLLQ